MPEWFFRGGIAMWPLLVCSIAGVAIILERMWALQRRRVISPVLAAAIDRRRLLGAPIKKAPPEAGPRWRKEGWMILPQQSNRGRRESFPTWGAKETMRPCKSRGVC